MPALLQLQLLLLLLLPLLPVSGATLRQWPKLDAARLSEKLLDQGPFANVKSRESGEPVVDPPRRVAGYFALDRSTHAGAMFYTFYQARSNPTKAPLVLWMTGGPGCSSELAVLYENGPYSLDRTGKSLVETPYGWDLNHNMVFVDQPIGTGFSYTTDPSDDDVYGEEAVAEDMLDFLQHFFNAHPELSDAPFFITGESYAGHYVPVVAHRVWRSNKAQEGPHINLQGIAIGNGITEPGVQMAAYGDFALLNKLITPTARMWMSVLYPPCYLAVRLCEATGWDWLCALGSNYCTVTQYAPILSANEGINVYDIRKKCVAPLCYDFSAADEFLNSAPVRDALGVPAEVPRWQMCSPEVYAHFSGDQLRRFDTLLPDMLVNGVRALIYAGDQDLICNYVGNRRWVDALNWTGSKGWSQAAEKAWVVNGEQAGLAKHFGPLTYLRVFNAGHMVPMDQDLNALAMISAFTRNFTLAGRWEVSSLLKPSSGPGAAAGARTLPRQVKGRGTAH